MEIKISVIFPVYNMGKYLQDSLDSIFRQTLKEIEIICINDGSTDDSLNILKKNCLIHDNVHIIDQENHGIGYSRNVGINAAAGEFIAFLDPDDYLISDNTYKRLYEAAKARNVKICGGSLCHHINNGEQIKKKFEGIYSKFTFDREELIDYRDYQFDFGFYRFIYDRQFLRQNNIIFPEYARFQDAPFFVHAMITAGQFYAIPDITYCYRVGHQSQDWSERKICDYLRGNIDVIRMSSEAGLKELHLLQLYRLSTARKRQIISGLERHSLEMLHLLDEVQSAIRTEWLEDGSKSAYAAYAHLFELIDDFRRMEKQLSQLKADKKKMAKQLSQMETDLRTERQKRHESDHVHHDHLEAVYASASWKIGNMIVQPLHLIKTVIKKTDHGQ